jgi:phosphatidylglycerophosphatase A
MNVKAESAAPRLALAVATSLGVGYAPIAPGTWGSAAGVALAAALAAATQEFGTARAAMILLVAAAILAAAGLWASSRVAAHTGISDPGFVVIDEVSGQFIALIAGAALTGFGGLRSLALADRASIFAFHLLDWKYLMAGFIIFRVFDIWKPFPARQAESLHGGWGIMADDWVAGLYAALALSLAQYLGL